MAREPLDAELDAVVDRIRADAYSRGWADAIANVLSAAQSAHAAPTAAQDTMVAPATSTKAGYGAVGASIDLTFDAIGERGVTPAEIIAHAYRELGETIKKSSVRGRLHRLAKNGQARNERGRWFRVRQSPEAAEQEDGDGDTSPVDRLGLDDGGRRAAA